MTVIGTATGPDALQGDARIEGDRVDLWFLDLTATAAQVRHLTALLDAGERTRAASMAGGLRQRFVVARGLTRTVLGGYLGRRPADLVWSYGSHGKPGLVGIEHSLSHHGNTALLGVAAQRPLGVDLAGGTRRQSPQALAHRCFGRTQAAALRVADAAERRRRFLRLWARKEACVKADGAQLKHGLRLPVDATASVSPTTGTVVRGIGAALPGPWWLCDVALPFPGAAAVAVQGVTPCRLLLHGARAPVPAERILRMGLAS